jgi:hypothetical protein
MKRSAAMLLALLLAGCGDVRDKPISSIDFTDSSSLQSIAQQLNPQERKAFGQYAMSRMMAGTMGGNEVTRPDGSEPKTVGEAIALTEARMAIADQRSKLMDERNEAVDRHNALSAPDGGVTNQAEWDRLEKVIDDYDKKIAALDAQK